MRKNLTQEEREALRLKKEQELMERRARLATQALSVAQQEALARERARKAERDKTKKRGELVAAAGLDALADDELLGGLMLVADILRAPHMFYGVNAGDGPLVEQQARILAAWAERGKKVSEAGEAPTVPVVATFTRTLTADEKRELKQAHLRWNSVRQEWSGKVAEVEVRALVARLGGRLELLVPPTPSPEQADLAEVVEAAA